MFFNGQEKYISLERGMIFVVDKFLLPSTEKEGSDV